MRRENGSVLLMVLMVGVILMALLAAEVTITRVNVRAVQNSTINAQLDVQAILSSPNAMRAAVARLPAELTRRATTPRALQTYGATFQHDLEQDWMQCSSAGRLVMRVFIDPVRCGVSNPYDSDTVSFRTLNNAVQEVRFPLTIQTTYTDTLGRRSRQARGEAVYRTGNGPLPITAYQVLSDQLGTTFPNTLILDGPVHVNGTLKFTSGRSEFLGGVSSATQNILLDNTSIAPSQFAPSAAFPCDQLNLACPKFDAGLSLVAPRLLINGLSGTADLTLSAAAQDLVLTPNPTGGTIIFACTDSSCVRYWYAPDGNLYQHRLASPVPPQDGLLFTPPELPNGAQPWDLVKEHASGVLLVAGDVQVRALTPRGAAFQGALTIAASGTLTVASNLSPLSSVCSTFPVRDDNGNLHAARCLNPSPDVLGLVSVSGNIDLGSTRNTAPDDARLSLQANLLAPLGTVSLQDPRLSALDWVGSVAANTFTPDARMHLAFDPRSATPPGFPKMTATLTPPTIRLEADGVFNPRPTN